MTVKKVRKAPLATKPITTLTKNRTWEDFLNKESILIFPQKDDWRKRFMLTMLEWSQQDDSLEIIDFLVQMKVTRSNFYEWLTKYPDLKEGYEQVKLIIASRRRTGALLKKYDKEMVMKDIHRYDHEWDAVNKYHAELKRNETPPPSTINVYATKPGVVSKEELAAQQNKMEE